MTDQQKKKLAELMSAADEAAIQLCEFERRATEEHTELSKRRNLALAKLSAFISVITQ
jgi:hypothetical protein